MPGHGGVGDRARTVCPPSDRERGAVRGLPVQIKSTAVPARTAASASTRVRGSFTIGMVLNDPLAVTPTIRYATGVLHRGHVLRNGIQVFMHGMQKGCRQGKLWQRRGGAISSVHTAHTSPPPPASASSSPTGPPPQDPCASAGVGLPWRSAGGRAGGVAASIRPASNISVSVLPASEVESR